MPRCSIEWRSEWWSGRAKRADEASACRHVRAGARSTGRRVGTARGTATRATYPVGSNAASFKPHSALACRSSPPPLPPMPMPSRCRPRRRSCRPRPRVPLPLPIGGERGLAAGGRERLRAEAQLRVAQRMGERVGAAVACVAVRSIDRRGGAARGAAARATRVRRVGTSSREEGTARPSGKRSRGGGGGGLAARRRRREASGERAWRVAGRRPVEERA